MPRVKVVKRKGKPNFVLRWQEGTRWRERSSGIPATRSNRRKAEREAAKLEGQVARLASTDIDWQGFVIRYDREHLTGLADKTRSAWQTALSHIDRVISPRKLADVTAVDLVRLTADLRASGRAETTIASYLRSIKAALRWAARMKLIEEAPTVEMPKRAKGVTRLMRSRPPTAEEFDRMVKAVAKVRPDDAEAWRRLLRGLWWSGLRLGEALDLSWDRDASFRVDLDREPVFRIWAEAEKGHSDRVLPMAPEFARFLDGLPGRRRGRVFKVPAATNQAGKIIGKIGKAARVTVAAGKHASAQDLRRAFGTRWAALLMPAELRILMRHRSINTTLAYYVDLDAGTLSAKLSQIAQGETSWKTQRV